MGENKQATQRIVTKAKELGMGGYAAAQLSEMILLELQAAYRRGMKSHPVIPYPEDMGR